MSRANSNNKNNPANRGALGHLKAGVKNIPKMYDALYNAKQGNAKLGVGSTVGGNINKIVKGRTNDQSPKVSGAGRAQLAAAGAASVTPLGPLVAMGLGIKKSVQDKKDAKAKIASDKQAKNSSLGATGGAMAMSKGIKAMKPSTTKSTAPTPKATKPTPTKSAKLPNTPQQLKKTLNEINPGLNMK